MVIRGYLMMLSIIMTRLIPYKEALECMVGEYEVDGQCCPICHAGYRVHETCTIMTGTTCVACDPGTYTAHQSGLKECLQCKVCDPEFGFMTIKECSSTSNTVCDCSPGYFCADMKGDDCELCVHHQVCTPGQYVKSRGTKRKNTICETCPEETFSFNGTLRQCLLWTNAHFLLGIKEIQQVTFKAALLVCTYFWSSFCWIALIADHITGRVILFPCGKNGDPFEADGSVTNLPIQETSQQDELLPLKERMSMSQDSWEP
ncbi:tumor necrosis factor receptor superfamily member 14-like isoform X2 [Trichosurus vulpecula]|uniref:tumor necrosis factor receptor superfamily member 14-like isoform X2 n=1 Tax=Trichosurus vulpecula TaxID=9337 RepID=UPI00186AC3C8|nr:tumor necrosis factor receptor superfamily member 14-like isoform X2 [Trichosurus vulpecula]